MNENKVHDFDESAWKEEDLNLSCPPARMNLIAESAFFTLQADEDDFNTLATWEDEVGHGIYRVSDLSVEKLIRNGVRGTSFWHRFDGEEPDSKNEYLIVDELSENYFSNIYSLSKANLARFANAFPAYACLLVADRRGYLDEEHFDKISRFLPAASLESNVTEAKFVLEGRAMSDYADRLDEYLNRFEEDFPESAGDALFEISLVHGEMSKRLASTLECGIQAADLLYKEIFEDPQFESPAGNDLMIGYLFDWLEDGGLDIICLSSDADGQHQDDIPDPKDLYNELFLDSGVLSMVVLDSYIKEKRSWVKTARRAQEAVDLAAGYALTMMTASQPPLDVEEAFSRLEEIEEELTEDDGVLLRPRDEREEIWKETSNPDGTRTLSIPLDDKSNEYLGLIRDLEEDERLTECRLLFFGCTKAMASCYGNSYSELSRAFLKYIEIMGAEGDKADKLISDLYDWLEKDVERACVIEKGRWKKYFKANPGKNALAKAGSTIVWMDDAGEPVFVDELFEN